MQTSEHLKHAIQIAADAHDGQMDKTGRPYFEHCQRVAAALTDEEAKIVAYLHDVPEKGYGWTVDRVKEEGFSPHIVSAVDTLTKRIQEDEDTFLRRISRHPLARKVKLADLEDNLWQVNLSRGNAEKYEHALEKLTEWANGALRQKW
ncbi:HD domain-containing protein [Ciceribacter azotifigens]|uniref:HD domain-containing protein n=1 Tax=Ciceribacter azotifigens TaxID=2069303 RepID=UPI003A874EBE